MKTVRKTPVEELSLIRRREEEMIAQKKAQELEIRYLNIDTFPLNVSDLVLLPEEEARTKKVFVAKKEGNFLLLAALHPGSPEVEALAKNFEERGYKVERAAVSFSSLAHAWEKYKLYKEIGEELQKVFIIEKARVKELREALKTRREVEDQLAVVKEADTSSLLEKLFIGAMQANASDIHIEPEKDGAKIRFRIDGVLQDITDIPLLLYSHIASRLKVLAQLKLNIPETAQDGRFTIRQQARDGAKDIDVRLALIPSYFGETIVMRLLGIAISLLDLDALGLEEHQKEIILANLALPNGMILSTGPTGSGKTTFLYSALNHIKRPEVNIITIEDPIEYRVEGITQTQVNPEKEYTFEKGLQAILRQDPDVVLVGEIRSEETATTAINAALTGHLVFSTLHTNDAPGAITRLQNLKVRLTLIPAALRLVIAQRLVRKLCPSCRQKTSFPLEHRSAVKKALALISPHSGVSVPDLPDTLFIAKGCEACFGTGYLGRTGIFELFELNDTLREKILAGATIDEVRKTAIESGMLTLLQHALLKMIGGQTSLEEVKRVAGDAKYIEEIYGEAALSLIS